MLPLCWQIKLVMLVTMPFWSWRVNIRVRAFHFKISFWIRAFLLSNKIVTSQGAVRNLPGRCLFSRPYKLVNGCLSFCVLEVLNYFEVNFLIYQSDNLFNLKVIEKNEICPHLIPLKITFNSPNPRVQLYFSKGGPLSKWSMNCNGRPD